ncbi:MAG: TonB-dependent receptor [Saprospiraceae bacterium]
MSQTNPSILNISHHCISILFLLMPLFSLAQPGRISLKEFLFQIEKTHNISIIYRSGLETSKTVDVNLCKEGDWEAMLKKVLHPYHLELKKIQERQYVILKKTKNKFGKKLSQPVYGAIYGLVLDERGEPLQGVNIYILDSKTGTTTNSKGEYKLENIEAEKHQIEVSYLGFLKQDTTFTISRRRKNHRFNFKLKPDLLDLKTVVITGVSQPVINLESGVAITSINQDDLNKIAPRSTADIFQNIPGFYAESSAGEVSNNLFSRGMPSEGSYQYVVLHEDGLPIYEAGNLDWVAADHFFRVDGTYKSIEAMRGGSAGVFAGNAPGGIINFVSKTGGSQNRGQFKLQIADFGQLRLEGEVGGPIDKTVRYHIGGFYRIDNGIRVPGFIANNGGQIKGNITKVYNNGYIRISGKYLNDKNIYYLPIPLKNTDEPERIESFDPNYGTLVSSNVRDVTFPTPYGEKNFDLSDGMHTNLGYIGTHVQFDLGDGWSFINKNRFSIVDKSSNAIVSLLSPRSVNSFLNKYSSNNLYEPVVTYADNQEPYNLLNANNNGLVVEAGWWANENILQNFVNSFEIKKKEDKYQISGNIYFSSFTNKTTRDWGSILLEVTSNQPRALNVDFIDIDSTVVESVTHNGFTTYQSLDTYLNGKGNASIIASYFHGKYFFNKKTSIDAGFRQENLFANGIVENTKLYNLNPDSLDNSVLRSVRYGDSTYTAYDVYKPDIAWTAGVNHLFSKNASAYIRFSESFRMPDFDNWQNGQYDGGRIENIFQAESGYKYTSKKYAFLFSGFYSYISNQITTDARIDDEGNLIPARTRDAQSYGMEVEGAAQVSKGFSVNVTATIQQAKYIVDIDQEFDLKYRVNGKDVKQIPNLFFIIQPSYEYKGVKIFGNIQYIGKRFSDEINIDFLPAFASYNLGLSYKYKSYSLLIHAQNLTNKIGLTEGNSRVIANTSNERFRMARPILGRSIIGYLAYQF